MANNTEDVGTTEFTATRKKVVELESRLDPRTKPITASVEAEQDGGTHRLEWEEKDDGRVIGKGSGRIREDGLDVEYVDGVPDHIADKYTEILGLSDPHVTGSARIDDERADQLDVDNLWRNANIELEAVEGEEAYRFEWEAHLTDRIFAADKTLGRDDATVSGDGVVWYDEGGEIKGDYTESVAEEVIDLVEQSTGAEIDAPTRNIVELPSWDNIKSLDESFNVGVSYEVDLEAYDEGLVVAWEGSNRSYDIGSSGEAAYDFEQDEWAAGNPPEMIKSATESIVQFYQSE